MPELTPETLFNFLDNLPTIRKIEREAGIPQGYLAKIKKRKSALTPEMISKLTPVLKEYNFKI